METEHKISAEDPPEQIAKGKREKKKRI